MGTDFFTKISVPVLMNGTGKDAGEKKQPSEDNDQAMGTYVCNCRSSFLLTDRKLLMVLLSTLHRL